MYFEFIHYFHRLVWFNPLPPWWNVEPSQLLYIVEEHGSLVQGKRDDLMVEFDDQRVIDTPAAFLPDRFGDQVLLPMALFLR